jgi:hypothetical protein
MSEPSNMTEAHLDAVMDALPDEMSEAELCALTLTIYSAYLDDMPSVISSLIAAIYTYGETRGLSAEAISFGLRMTADTYGGRDGNQTTH